MSARLGRSLASRLLRQVGSYRTESLVGDLIEERARGRSASWFWRQVMLAIVRTLLRRARAFGPSLVRAFLLSALGVQIGIAGVQWLSDWVWREELTVFGMSLSAADLRMAEHVLFWGAWTPLTAALYAVLGRFITAFDPRCARWTVVTLVLCVLGSRLPWTFSLVQIPTEDAQYVSYAMQDMIATLICAAGAALGGLSCVPRAPPVNPDRGFSS